MSARMRAARATRVRVEWPASMALRWQQPIQNYAFEHDMLNVCAFVDAPLDERALTSVKLWGHIDGQDREVLMGEATLATSESSINTLARLTAYAQCQELDTATTEVKFAITGTKSQELAVTYKLVTQETNFILVHQRTDAEKAREMPKAHNVAQMMAAGWGGTGSVAHNAAKLRVRDDFSIAASHSTVKCSNNASADYGSMSKPAVWRSSTQAASRVDALSRGGMDDFEIPAFLRKQADEGDSSFNVLSRQGIDKKNPAYWKKKPVEAGRRTGQYAGPAFIGITPAGVEHWLAINDANHWPTTYAELIDLGLELAVCEWLELGIGEGRDEASVVSTFLGVIREFGFANLQGIRKAFQTIKSAVSPRPALRMDSVVATQIRNDLKGITGYDWPPIVVNFPESASA